MMKSTKDLPTSQNDGQGIDVYLTLDIKRGKTSHPLRPVKTARFLIGSGSGCHLSLGGGEIPPLHTILFIQSGEVLAEAIAGSPPLTANGNAVSSVVLEDGDVLGIGSFEFTVRINAEVVARTAESLSDLDEASLEIDDEEIPEVSEMSAEELVDLIASELSVVEEYEQSIQSGGDALLSAIRARQLEDQPRELPTRHLIHGAHQLRGPRIRPVTVEDEQLVHEFERVRRELEDFSHELEKRFDRVTKREAHFDAAAKELIEAQSKLSAQLGTLLEQIETRHGDLQPRAIA